MNRWAGLSIARLYMTETPFEMTLLICSTQCGWISIPAKLAHEKPTASLNRPLRSNSVVLLKPSQFDFKTRQRCCILRLKVLIGLPG